MIIFATVLFVANMLVTEFFGFVYTNTSAIYSLLALLIFAAIAMMFLQETRRYAGVALFIAVVLYAGIDILAPYTWAIGWIVSAVLAIVATVIIKRPMLRMVRRNRQTLPAWSRVLLSIL